MSQKAFKRSRSVKPSVAAREIKRIARAAAKKAIADSEEVKRYVHYATNYISNAGNSIVNVYTLGYGLWPLSPYSSYVSISQGTGDGQRIGNRIMVKSAKLRVKMDPAAYNATYNPTPTPMFVKCWIFKMKQNNTLSDVQTLINSNFKDSNNSSVGLAGTDADYMLADNNSEVTVLWTKMYKIGYANNQGSGSVNTEEYKANNDFKVAEYFEKDITRYLSKHYDFNDSGTTPFTQPVTWFLVEAISATGTYTDMGERPGQIGVSVELNYTDA